MKFGTDIHVPLKMNNFGSPFTFPLAPSPGQNLNYLLNTRKTNDILMPQVYFVFSAKC